MRLACWGLLGLVVLAGGCVSPAYRTQLIKERASFDLNCPSERIRVSEVNPSRRLYGAQGCGRRASYYARACNRNNWRFVCSVEK
ncbi:MAG: hypothetical protein RLZZ450_2844 [Pseudomonadota bacterium]|jgi:hypothetical protein